MIQVPPNASVVIMHESISFRSGIDGTAAVARLVLKKEPMDGAIFVFRNRQRHMLRVLYYDGSGFWLCTKRLERGTFGWIKTADASTDLKPIFFQRFETHGSFLGFSS